MPRSAKMSDATIRTIESERRRSRFVSVAVVLLTLVLSAVILYQISVLISREAPSSFVAYNPPPPDRPDDYVPMQKDLSGGAPPVSATSVMVALDNTSLMAAASVNTDAISGSLLGTEDGLDGDFGLGGIGNGIGSGIGDGLSGGSAGMGDRESGGSSFCGRFWDLKKTRLKADSELKDPIANLGVMELMSRFYNGNWDTNLFRNYYESSVNLYAACFYMPLSLDKEASNAYDPDGSMGLEPSRWVAVYSARVKAPKTGRFRFVGIGDSVMGVRFNGKNVLQCGFHSLETGAWNANVEEDYIAAHEFYEYRSCGSWNMMFGGFRAGEYFEVKEGEWYEMQVLVSEIGGGAFGFCLLIDEEGAPRKLDADGVPIFQLFRTAFVEPNMEEAYAKIKFPCDEGGFIAKVDPPYDPDSRIWEAEPIEVKRNRGRNDRDGDLPRRDRRDRRGR